MKSHAVSSVQLLGNLVVPHGCCYNCTTQNDTQVLLQSKIINRFETDRDALFAFRWKWSPNPLSGFHAVSWRGNFRIHFHNKTVPVVLFHLRHLSQIPSISSFTEPDWPRVHASACESLPAPPPVGTAAGLPLEIARSNSLQVASLLSRWCSQTANGRKQRVCVFHPRYYNPRGW